MKYDSLRALAERAAEANVTIGEMVIRDQMEESGGTYEEVYERMAHSLQVMKESVIAGM